MPRSSSFVALETDQVRVYYAPSSCVAEPERRARCLEWLSDAERERYLRFHFERDRQSYLAAHALTREVLGDELEREPRDLEFTLEEHGRPELARNSAEPRLRFNLSHTHGLVACGLVRGHDLGVDVEHVQRRLELERLAESVFSDAERAALGALPSSAQRDRFFELWTLKEAYIKAIGKGLSVPLRSISIELDAEHPQLRLEDDPGAGERWRLEVRRIAPAHMLAIAVDCASAGINVAHRLPRGRSDLST